MNAPRIYNLLSAPRCFLWVALNPEVGSELSPNFQDTTIWDKINANRRIGLNHCEAVSKELRIDILRLPTRNSEEPYYLKFMGFYIMLQRFTWHPGENVAHDTVYILLD